VETACLDSLLQAFCKEAIRENLANETRVKTVMKRTPFPTLPSGETVQYEEPGVQKKRSLRYFYALRRGFMQPPAAGHRESRAHWVTAFRPGSCPHAISHQQLEGISELKAATIYCKGILPKPKENDRRALKGSCKPTRSPRGAEPRDPGKHCHVSLPRDLASCSGYDLPLLLLG